MISATSVTSMAVGGLLGDTIGIRTVCLAAGALVVISAAIAWIMFRGGRSAGPI